MGLAIGLTLRTLNFTARKTFFFFFASNNKKIWEKIEGLEPLCYIETGV